MRLPDNNFGRIILMNFILFCLIIRTGYQGVLFEMLSTDMRKQSPNTMEELYKQNYTIYLWHFDQAPNVITSLKFLRGLRKFGSKF
jgi:hypothetical protein